MLDKLTMINACSGNEQEMIDFILSECKSYDVSVDAMGNVIVYKKGRDNSKKVMIYANIDEAALVIKDITKEGFLKFSTVGKIEEHNLLGKRVKIKDIYGVIGLKAVHLSKKKERESAIKIEDMYIDIGAGSLEQAQGCVSKGDNAFFCSDYVKLGANRVKTKALSNRCGVYVLLQLLKSNYHYDMYFVFATQGEIAHRGAVVCANKINPDIVLMIDTTAAWDVLDVKDHLVQSKLGMGCVLSYSNGTGMTNRKFLAFIEQIADETNIKYQYKKGITEQKNDISTTSNGTIVATISIPCRYINCPNSIVDIGDLTSAFSLSAATLKSINKFFGGA